MATQSVSSEPATSQEVGFLLSLGIYTKFTSAHEKQGLADTLVGRFYLQSLARELVGGQRVAICLRWLSPHKEEVQIRLSGGEGGESAHYGHLVVCGSVWSCPVCAARITEQRRVDLGAALALWGRKRKQVVMVTYTLSHGKQTLLADVLKTLKKARERFKSGRRWQRIKESYRIVGTIGATEVTWGENGWHPHVHELVFFDTRYTPDWLLALESTLQAMWQAALAKEGGTAVSDIGLKLVVSNAKIGNYVAKFGREAGKESGWELEHEMTKNPTKKGHADDHATPLELLIGFGNGSTLAGDLWREYALSFHGKQQLVWSVGLKERLKVTVKEDSEIASAEELPYHVLASIPRDVWYSLIKRERRNGWRGKLLKIALVEGLEGVQKFIASE